MIIDLSGVDLSGRNGTACASMARLGSAQLTDGAIVEFGCARLRLESAPVRY